LVEIEDAARPRSDWKWTGSVLLVGYRGGPTHRTHHHSRRGSRSVPGVGVVGQCRMSGSSVTAECWGRRSVPDVGQCRVVGTQDRPLAHGPGLLRCLIWAGCLRSTLGSRLSTLGSRLSTLGSRLSTLGSRRLDLRRCGLRNSSMRPSPQVLLFSPPEESRSWKLTGMEYSSCWQLKMRHSR
jgi:hypothetical protein